MALGLLKALGLKPKVPSLATAPAGEAAPPLAGDSAGPPQAAPPVDRNKAAFDAARAPVQKLVDDLNAHPQKARITTEIGNANAKLAAADAHAAKGEYKDAKLRIEEARAICVKAKKLADDWATYAKLRYDTLALIMAFKSADSADWAAAQLAIVATADAQAGSTPPDFAGAAKTLKTTDAKELKPEIKSLVTTVKKRLAKMQAMDAKVRTFAQAEIDSGGKFVAQAEKAFAAGEWSLCQQTSMAALDVLGPADRMAERRGKYETQRGSTLKAIAPVKASAAVKDRAKSLDDLVAKADALAAHDSLKFEAGIQVLADTSKLAAMWVSLASTLSSYTKEIAAADTELATLDKHSAAAKLTAERDAIRKLVADVKAFASQADASADPVAAWNSALTHAKRARADLAVATKLADGLGPAAAAEAAAGAKPPNPADLKAALAKLRADAKAAGKAAHAASAEAEFKRFNEQADAADKALAANDAATAATAMADAAKALVAARSIQAEHAQFTSTLAGVEAQLKKLKALPRAKLIQPKIDPVVAALADAKTKDAAHDGPGAMAALRSANDAVAAATQADKDRGNFDSAQAALAKRIKATKDAAKKTAMETALVDAKKKADALDFDGAIKALKQVEVSLDKLKLEGMMSAKKPDEKAIAATAGKMVENGGATEVDAMVQAVPDGGDPKLVNALAKGRYGITFTSGKPLDAAGDPVAAMKKCCEMFAKIPQDIRKNPSIKAISHVDAIDSAGGGYDFDNATIEMSGRPNVIDQEFGSKQKQQDPNGGPDVDQLVGVEADCLPTDEAPLDFLSFAAAHEVGHGVDDKNSFMAQNGSKPEFGGWIVYGASVQPLADIVGPDSGFYTTPEQKQYVLDTLMSKPTTPPAVAPGSPEEAALKKFDNWYALATSADIFRRQGDCDKITIAATKRIYHEAYARNWVSYLADARKKGLTGYQFRAPGEWFAELYAGYRSGKLKPTHPAMSWLKKL